MHLAFHLPLLLFQALQLLRALALAAVCAGRRQLIYVRLHLQETASANPMPCHSSGTQNSSLAALPRGATQALPPHPQLPPLLWQQLELLSQACK